MRFSNAAPLALLLAVFPARAGKLVVLNKAADEAALVDAASLEVVARVPTGHGPHEIAIVPGGATALVTNYGGWVSPREGEKPQLHPGSSITVIDLKEKKPRATWSLGDGRLPHGIAVSRDGKRAWVTSEGTQKLLELDASAGTIVRSWSIAQHVNHMVAPSRDESRLYVTNIASGSVTIIDRAKGKSKTVATGEGTEGIDLAPDGREVWVANRAADSIAILDASASDVVATIPSGGKFPIRLRFAPDGRQVWVSNAGSDQVAVIDASSREVVGTIAVPKSPIGLVFRPDGARVYVSCSGADRVVEVDAATRAILRSVETGKEPDGIAWVD